MRRRINVRQATTDALAHKKAQGQVYAALPTASNAYIMARQMGGDAPLMASLVTWQTLLAAATVPLVMQLPAWLA